MAPHGAGRIFVPTNPDLADILGRTDLDFENFYFLDFLDPTFLDVQVPRYPNSQICRFPDFQTPPAPAPPDPDELSDPNLTPLPTHPGMEYIARALAATNFHRLSVHQKVSCDPSADHEHAFTF